MTASSAVSATPLTPPWPADAGYFRSGNKPLRLVKLSRQYACCATPGCHEAIFSDGGQWRHERNLSYQCPSGAGWADSFDPEAAARQLEEMEERHAEAIQQECEVAAADAEHEGFENGRDEGLDEGREQGRKEMYAEIDAALTGALDSLNGIVAASDLNKAREALADAWNSCAP